jgi:putative flippase GtrA
MISEFIKRNREFIKFLIVGGWNTLFGYGLFIILFYLPWKLHYIIVLIISNIIAITNAYICYKFFVFKTRGNYVREYIKFYGVYGVTFLIGLLLLPVFVEVFKIHPVISQGLLLVITIFWSYFGHKHASFKRPTVLPQSTGKALKTDEG